MSNAGSPPAEASRNPSLLICDTSSLIPLILADQVSILKKLKRQFDIQPAVIEAVESEMLRTAKPKMQKCAPQFKKALKSGVIEVLDQRTLGAYVTTDAASTYNQIELKGREYGKTLGKGEAYTHAAGVVLNMPALSDDAKAVRQADRQGIAIARPTLRTYDLVCLFHQIGDLTVRDCENIRDRLLEEDEGIHEAFASRKFVDGLSIFFVRALESSQIAIGSQTARELGDERLLVSQRKQFMSQE